MSTADKLNKILETKADIKLALIDKGLNPSDVFSTYADNIRAINGSIWTGHVDVEGLKAIGWDDEDIAYFQKHGVNWMEEDDEYHKVSDDNKALYGVLNWDNIQEYKDRIVWLPKLGNFSGSFALKFKDYEKLKGIPILDMQNVTSMAQSFYGCKSLTCIYLRNTSKVTGFNSTFRDCTSLRHIHPIDTSTNGARDYAFLNDENLEEGISLNLAGDRDIRHIYDWCRSMKRCDDIDASGRDIDTIFTACVSLSVVRIKNLCSALNLKGCIIFGKNSLLYMIENEAATELITITLHSVVYSRLSTDPDIVAALNNHPNVSLASA